MSVSPPVPLQGVIRRHDRYEIRMCLSFAAMADYALRLIRPTNYRTRCHQPCGVRPQISQAPAEAIGSSTRAQDV
jgi:hypothetical protein